MPDLVRVDQVPGDEAAEGAGGAGDQHGAVGDQVDGAGRVGLGRGEARHEQPPVAERDLGLAGGEGAAEQVGVGFAVEVGEDEPVGVLQLRRADQAPHGGPGQVGDVRVGGDRAAGEHHESPVGEPVVGQPVPHRGEGVGEPRAGAGERVARRGLGGGQEHQAGVGVVDERGEPAGRVERHDPGCRSGWQRQRGPAQVEQGQFGGTGVELVGAEGPGDQRVDPGDGRAGGVGEGEGGGRAVAGEAYPQVGRALGGERDAGPGPGQAGAGVVVGRVVGEADDVQGGVEQRRVQGVPGGGGAVGQFHLREDLFRGTPGGAQPAEGGPVIDAEPVQAGVDRVDRHGGGAGRRPLGQRLGRFGSAGGEDPVGVAGPVGVRVVGGPGMDGDPAVALLVGGGELELHAAGARVGQDERRGEGQFRQGVAAGPRAGVQRQFHERGAGYDDPPPDDVVGEPGLGPPGEPAAVDADVVGGGDEFGVEQGVAGVADAQSGGVGAGGAGV
ncbi:hypothetical protein B0E53_07024 [Micromonospora sp. MH33]|nr:hypothetical protein B0E53_07024 [Micromonospora sp. MH33]